MKTVEEVAEEIWKNLSDRSGCGIDSRDQEIQEKVKGEIIKVLKRGQLFQKEVANFPKELQEAGKDGIDALAYLLQTDEIANTRNQVLEEAAQMVNSCIYEKGLSVTTIDLAEQIRALKTKETK